MTPAQVLLNPVYGSSNVAATGHDPSTNTMYVKFHNGGTYSYPNRTAEEHQALRAAPSIGKHLHQFHVARGDGERV